MRFRAIHLRWQSVFLTLVVFLCLSLRWVSAGTPLVFLADKDYAPMSYLEDGIAKGMDVELGKALEGPMRREIRIELADWNVAQQKVLNGEADGLLGMTINDERRGVFDFAKPMFVREFALLVREGEKSIQGIGDLKGRKVGVTSGGFPKAYLETKKGAQLISIDNYLDGFRRLTSGEIDAVAADLWVGAYLIEKEGIQGIVASGPPFATAPAAIAVRKGNTALISEINDALRTLRSKGITTELQEKWMPQEMLFVSRKRAQNLVVLASLSLMLLLLCGMGVWIYTLQKQIESRKRTELALRASEERFQLAVRGSSDGLWDRNILTDEVFFADRFRELLGYSPHEFAGEFASFESHIHPEDKSRVMEMLTGHLEERKPYDAEYRLRTKSGEYRWFRGRGQAVWDSGGRAVRMAGSITDITQRKRAEEQITLLQTITMDVATAKDLSSAFEVVLRRVCEKTGWDLGQAWIPKLDGLTLDCCRALYASSADLHDFCEASKSISFRPGEGLPGRVWAAKEAKWVSDVTADDNFPRAKAALAHGLKAGLAVPILAGDEVLAVLEFFLKEIRIEDKRLIQGISAIAAQIGVAIDRKRAEEKLRWREQQFRLLLDSTAEGIFGVNCAGECSFCNSATLRLLDYSSEDELLGKEMHSLIAHSYADGSTFPKETCPVVQSLTSAAQAHSDQDVFWRKDATYFPVEYWSYPIYREGRHVGAVVTFLDITERKQADREARASQAQLRALAGRLQKVREEERTSVAREIHDVLAQELTRLKIDLGWLQRRLSSDEQARVLAEKVTSMLRQSDIAISSVQKIATELRPVVLDSLGLAAAIEWQAEEFQARTGIQCNVKIPMEEIFLSQDAATGLFRIVQESLTNVSRHAEATRVEVGLEATSDALVLSIQDNGVGIDPMKYKDAHTLGLVGMRERTLLLGGHIEITGRPGEGTLVRVTTPIGEETAAASKELEASKLLSL